MNTKWKRMASAAALGALVLGPMGPGSTIVAAQAARPAAARPAPTPAPAQTAPAPSTQGVMTDPCNPPRPGTQCDPRGAGATERVDLPQRLIPPRNEMPMPKREAAPGTGTTPPAGTPGGAAADPANPAAANDATEGRRRARPKMQDAQPNARSLVTVIGGVFAAVAGAFALASGGGDDTPVSP